MLLNTALIIVALRSMFWRLGWVRATDRPANRRERDFLGAKKAVRGRVRMAEVLSLISGRKIKLRSAASWFAQQPVYVIKICSRLTLSSGVSPLA